jgi:MFS family permease
MLVAWPLGIICDRLDRRRVMCWVALVAAGSAVVAAMLGATNLWLLMVAAGAFMGLSAALYPIAVAITNDRMEHHRIVAASATLLLSYGIGSVIGPIVMAEMVGLLGPRGLFLGNAVVLVMLVIFTTQRIRTTYDIPVADQGHFVATMPAVSTVLAEIDPRNDEFQHGDPDSSALNDDYRRAS